MARTGAAPPKGVCDGTDGSSSAQKGAFGTDGSSAPGCRPQLRLACAWWHEHEQRNHAVGHSSAQHVRGGATHSWLPWVPRVCTVQCHTPVMCNTKGRVPALSPALWGPSAPPCTCALPQVPLHHRAHALCLGCLCTTVHMRFASGACAGAEWAGPGADDSKGSERGVGRVWQAR